MTSEKEYVLENQEHIVINIWNIKEQGTDRTFAMFYVDLKPENNNKDINEIRSLFHCKIRLTHYTQNAKFLNNSDRVIREILLL